MKCGHRLYDRVEFEKLGKIKIHILLIRFFRKDITNETKKKQFIFTESDIKEGKYSAWVCYSTTLVYGEYL